MVDGEAEPSFRFTVEAAFTIRGRGTVVAGLVESGAIGAGDRVAVVHGDERLVATCNGVEMIHFTQPHDLRTVGLLLPELATTDVSPGDVIIAEVDS